MEENKYTGWGFTHLSENKMREDQGFLFELRRDGFIAGDKVLRVQDKLSENHVNGEDIHAL